MKYIVANWKMHLGVRESVALARGVLRSVRGRDEVPDIVLCPAFTSLGEVHKAIARSKVQLGAQSCGPAKSGAYTGEISPSMVRDVGSQFVIIGHSERRAMGESDALIRQKLEAALVQKLTPIVCVGETPEQRESGEAIDVIRDQLRATFEGLKMGRKQKIMIAYEPIWAIGTGVHAEVADVVEMHTIMRDFLANELRVNFDQCFFLYGGSVNADNAYPFLREQSIDGVLVGGASLKLRQFKGIIDAAQEVLTAQSQRV